MKKKIAALLLMLVCFTAMVFTGCTNEPNPQENNSVIPLTQLVNLSPAGISMIKLSQGDGMQTEIVDPEQIQEICSFLSAVQVASNYTERYPDPNLTGGAGSYFLIKRSNQEISHIQIFLDPDVPPDAWNVQITGATLDGEIQGHWNVHSLTDFSQLDQLKQTLSMQPNPSSAKT